MRTREEVAERIKELGLKKGFVAESINVGIAMFSLYLKGERRLKPEQELELNKFLDARDNL